MASIADIALGVANTLSTVSGLDVTDYVPESVNAPPAAFVNLGEIAESSFGLELLTIRLDAVVVVARGAAARIGQRSLYDLYREMVDAIVTNEDLSLGDGTRAYVLRYRSLSVEEIAALNLYGGAFEIEVTTPG